MKCFIRNIACALFILTCVLISNATVANAQKAASSDAKTVRNVLADFVRAKKLTGGGYTLLTPGDLKALSGGISALSVDANDPCEEAMQINIGQTVGNALNPTDCRLDDGSYADFYVFTANQGQQVTIQMDSSSVDSYLGITNETGSFVLEDDDSGGGLSARIQTTLPETGMYAILANSALPGEYGGYTLALSGAARCTFTVSPNAQTVEAAGGTYSFNISTQPECYWSAISVNNFTTIANPNGRGSGTVSYTVAQNGTGSTRSGSILVGSAPLPGVQTYFTITQSSVACAYALSPASANISASAQNGSFLVIAPSGCAWSASGTYWTTTNTRGSGSGQVSYFIRHNNGAPRTDYININDSTGNRILTFLVYQDGLNCNFVITPREMKVGRQGGTRSINISAQPGCQWSALSNSTFIHLVNTAGSGAGAVTFRVDAQTEQQNRSGAIQFTFNTDAPFSSAWIDQSKFSFASSDFDGDGKADISVWRPSNGVWYLLGSNSPYTGVHFGISSDKMAPADFDGDGKTDIAVYRDGNWFIRRSTSGFLSINFGSPGDIPAPADFDGDGRAELAVFRPGNGVWYVLNLTNNAFGAVQFGQTSDVPVAADYDGDGKSDYAVWRPSNGVWYMLRSRDGFTAVQFGIQTDKPVVGDYDGDGRADQAVYRGSGGTWFLNQSSVGFASINFGLSTDIPAPADFDGDGKTDIAVFRPENGTWYQQRTTLGFGAVQFGVNGDIPTPAAFVP